MSHLDYKQRATHAYAQLFITIARLDLGDDAIGQAFRRMAFNVMAKNCDDHSKNFAFRLQKGGTWELAPAYDVTHAHNPRGEWTYQHLLSVNGRFSGITRADLLAEADRFGVRRPQDALKEVRTALDHWPDFARQAGLGDKAIAAIHSDFEPA
jgi:serine/threonine-protein kinase HipA